MGSMSRNRDEAMHTLPSKMRTCTLSERRVNSNTEDDVTVATDEHANEHDSNYDDDHNDDDDA